MIAVGNVGKWFLSYWFKFQFRLSPLLFAFLYDYNALKDGYQSHVALLRLNWERQHVCSALFYSKDQHRTSCTRHDPAAYIQ